MLLLLFRFLKNFSELADAHRENSSRGSGAGDHDCRVCDAYWAHRFLLSTCHRLRDGRNWEQRCPEGPSSGRAPGDQSSGFQIAQSSGKHVLGNVSNVTAQLPMPVRPFFEREEDLRRPSADKDRVAASFRSRYKLVFAAHEINLAWNVEMLGVTSVAGFQSAQARAVVRDKQWTR
jgi:hypothetical protein